MNTNKFFNAKRFWNLFRNDMMINHKRYLFVVLGITIVLFLYFVWDMNRNPDYDYRLNSYSDPFAFLLMAMGAIIGMAFPDLSEKKNTCNYLLRPASIFEKYLVQILIYFVLFAPLAFSIFWIDTRLARLTVIHLNLIHTAKIELYSFSESYKYQPTLDIFMMSMAVFSMGIFLFVSRLFFKRFALVKSLILAVGLIYTFYVVMSLMTQVFYPEYSSNGFRLNDFRLSKDITCIQLCVYCMASLSWLFLLPIGYHKLKERQE